MILVLGKGQLAQSIKTRFEDAILVGRPEYDFARKLDCDRLFQQYPTPSYVINTVGTMGDDVWDNLMANFVSPCYIAAHYIDQTQCHVINISSASAWWVSYPGLSLERFSYNIAKESLSNFGKHMNRITIDDCTKGSLTTIEPGMFQSKMSNFRGQDIQNIVDCIELAMSKKLQHMARIK
jgi:hypothetical protein